MAEFTDSYSTRTKSGNIAEVKAMEYFQAKDDLYCCRFGFDEGENRIPIVHFNKIPKVLRNTPDLIVIKEKTRFVEVKGCKNVLRVKVGDMNSYDFWNGLADLYFFVLDVSTMKHKIFPYKNIKELADRGYLDVDVYPDNLKEYYKLPFSTI